MTLIIVLFMMSVVLFIAIIWAWNVFVSHAKFEAIRGYLLLALSLMTGTEVRFASFVTQFFLIQVLAYSCGMVKWFFLPVVLFINIYGFLDAVVRFPSVPQLESYFCGKLFLSVLGKTVVYAVGFIGIKHWALLFLSALFLNVWLLPVLYVLAIPFGDTSPFHKDRDMLVRLFLCAADPKERELALHSLRMSWMSFKRAWGLTQPVAVSPRRANQTALHSTSPVRTEFVLHDKAYI